MPRSLLTPSRAIGRSVEYDATANTWAETALANETAKTSQLCKCNATSAEPMSAACRTSVLSPCTQPETYASPRQRGQLAGNELEAPNLRHPEKESCEQCGHAYMTANVGIQRLPKAVRWNAGFGCWSDAQDVARHHATRGPTPLAARRWRAARHAH
jgi:hypothetical protein